MRVEVDINGNVTEYEDAPVIERAKEEILNQQINEAKSYINGTGWIWEKYNRNVLVLKDLTDGEFRLKYNDIINLQEESRLLINTLEIELNNLLGVE